MKEKYCNLYNSITSHRSNDELLKDVINKNQNRTKVFSVKKAFIVPAVAVLGLSVTVLTAGAVVYNNSKEDKQIVNEFEEYENVRFDVKNYDKLIYEKLNEMNSNNILISKNEHFKVTIEYVFVDDYYINGYATFEALDDTAKELMKRQPQAYELNYFNPLFFAFDENGNELSFVGSGGNVLTAFDERYVDNDTKQIIGFNIEKARLKNNDNIYLKFYELWNCYDKTEDLYSGIELFLNISANVETLTLKSGDKEIYMTPFNFYRRKENYYYDYEPDTFMINFKSGESYIYDISCLGDNYFELDEIKNVIYFGEIYTPVSE